jgi:peptidoglycan/LPS O-acetylase OafA/YrhL
MTDIVATPASASAAASVRDATVGTAALRGGHNAGLDLLRTVACLMVVAFHLHAVLGIDFGPANVLVNGGDAGVFIFFVLSGYLLYRPFVRGDVDLVSYGIKRAARIIPGYFVALLSLVILTRNSLPLEHPLPYLTISSSYNTELRGFLGNAWTLSAELIFYVLLPVIARFVRGAEIPRLLLLGACSAAAGVAYRLAFGPGNEWLFGSFPFVAYAFVPGMLLAFAEVRRPALLRGLAAWWVPIVGVAFLALETQLRGFPFALGAAVGTPLLIVWLRGVRVPFGRFLAFTGGASYALYLWHKDLLITFGLLGFGLLGLLIAVAGSAASWSFVERPILEAAHLFVARYRPSPNRDSPVPVVAP